jgi:hypothetical protein
VRIDIWNERREPMKCTTQRGAAPVELALTACNTLQSIASGSSYFYSDTGSNAAGGTNRLATLFSQIAYSLTKPRSIPQNAS